MKFPICSTNLHIPSLLSYLTLPAGMHWLYYQRKTPNKIYASEQADPPVPIVALCGVTIIRVHGSSHDCTQHSSAHDEGITFQMQ